MEHSVPGLDSVRVLDRDRAFSGLDFGSQLTSCFSVGMPVHAAGVAGVFVRRKDSGISAGGRVDVEVEANRRLKIYEVKIIS